MLGIENAHHSIKTKSYHSDITTSTITITTTTTTTTSTTISIKI
jgi:hypothetical protein